MEYLSALIVGLVGSLHCAGMCGPIAIAIPLNNQSWFSRIFGTLVYNTGRTLTYAILGAIFGLAGFGLALGGLQQWVSIALGALMILSVIVPRIGKAGKSVTRISEIVSGRVKRLFGKYFKIRTYPSLMFLGILNGFLPCGLVYIALAGALVMNQVAEGALYMVFFGLGTLPVLLLLGTGFSAFVRRYRRAADVVSGVLMIALAADLALDALLGPA